jgi:hypothetical protein
MAKQKIIFGEWLPDQPSVTGAVMDAYNCYPVTNGYAPFRQEADYSANAGQDLLITFAGKYAGVTNLFAASATQVYKYNSSNTNLDSVSTTYTSDDPPSWDVTQFGSKMIIANGVNKLQAYDMAGGSSFADLAAAAPVTKYVTVVRDFVVAADDGSDNNKVYWSDINDETDWTPSSASQSDTQVLPDGGDITGLAGGETGLIFMERAIYRMTYVGSPFFFQFDAISRTLGCSTNGSIAQFGGITYFLSDDGFYACDGQTTKSIGAEKVNRWFFDNAIPSEIRTSMSATVDPVRKLIAWNFKNTFGGRYLLLYSIDLGRWSYAETTATSVAYGLTPSATLEQIDIYFLDTTKNGTYTQSGNTVTVNVTDHGLETNGQMKFDATSGAGVDGTFAVTRVNANSFTFQAAASATITSSNCTITLPNLDYASENIPLDSRVWAGGILIFMGVTGQKIISFSGQFKSAAITSGDIDVGRSVITFARPIIDNGTGTVSVASRELLEDDITFSTAVAANSEGGVPLRSAGRYHRIKMSPTSTSWKTAVSTEIEIVGQGAR